MTTTTFSPEVIIQVAKQEAQEAFDNYEPINPLVCGFAYAKVKLDARTKAGKELIRLGFRSDYCGLYSFSFYDMVFSSTQSIEFKEAAVKAFVQVLNSYGIDAFVSSRLD